MDAMDEKKTVDIDPSAVETLASAMGLLTRAFSDWDKDIFDRPHHLSVPGIFVSTFLLDRKLGGEFFRVAWASFLDVASVRRLLPYTPKEVLWPEWDKESLEHPELIPIYDLAIMLAAFNLAAKQDEFPPEMFLGPLFTFSGFVVAGVNRGYNLEDEKTKTAYHSQRESLAASHGSPEEFKEALGKQLSSISDALESRKADLAKKVN